MKKLSRFGVTFVGYMARVVRLRNETEIDYAQLDFVSGSVILMTDNAWVSVADLHGLAPFVESLPGRAGHLREMLNTGTSETMVKFGKNSVSLCSATNVNRAIRQLSKRCSQALPALVQAKDLGKQIRRRPYREYIDEIAATGISRVVVHGFGIFENGTLSFHPERRELLVRATEEERTFSVEPSSLPSNPNAVGSC
jgi:hypothetical protein